MGEGGEIEKRTMFDQNTVCQEKHDEVTEPTSTVRPVCGPESMYRVYFLLQKTGYGNDVTTA